MVDIKRKKNQKSSSRQIIKYYKSSHKNVLPVKMDKNEKNVETLSLLSLSYPKYNNDNPLNHPNSNHRSNSTDYLKQKNGILKKLDTLNKKLKETFKQLQVTTSKSFINFNFNHTQIKEFSTILSYPLSNTKSTTTEEETTPLSLSPSPQKNSKKLKDSSIPKPSYHCLKYFQKNKILSSSDSALPHTPSGNADADPNNKINVLRDERKSKDTNDPALKMNETTSKYRMLYPLFYSALIKLSKTENKIVDKSKNKHSTSPSLPIPIEKRELLEDIVMEEKDIVMEEKDSYNNNNSRNYDNNNINNNNNNNINRNYENNDILRYNETETELGSTNSTESKDSLEFEGRNLQELEKNLFKFPEGLALVLFILCINLFPALLVEPFSTIYSLRRAILSIV